MARGIATPTSRAWPLALAAGVVYTSVGLVTAEFAARAAWHIAAAVGLGAFGLAVAANLHRVVVSPGQLPPLLALSLAIWPVMTALPAFVVALAAVALLARVRRGQA